jgi:hypothetical protein
MDDDAAVNLHTQMYCILQFCCYRGLLKCVQPGDPRKQTTSTGFPAQDFDGLASVTLSAGCSLLPNKHKQRYDIQTTAQFSQ